MNTQENNQLIAEFMGYEVLYRPYSNGFIQLSETELCDVDDLEYHSSWYWLMPVAKKCINPEVNTEGWDNLAVALTTCNIDEVYQAVVEFIKQYNK
jgi:hypothetical protein